MAPTYSVLIFGASYGSLLAVKLLGAGHDVTLVCRPATAQLINAEGIRVRMPSGAGGAVVDIDSQQLPGRLSAMPPANVECGDHDLAVLAMQEPQYGTTELRDALRKVAHAKLPCMSVMNMPPLPYLARVPGLALAPLRSAFTDPAVWDDFDPTSVTLCSPDPQAFRPPGEKPNVLHVRLATNFKAAPFASARDTAMLERLQTDIDNARFPAGEGSVALPVKLKVHRSLHVPLAKWSMLLAGNYRCVGASGMRSIAAAVHGESATARRVYGFVAGVCKALGATDEDLVPFEKYSAAAASLSAPSSAARALAAGATQIERVDRLVQIIAAGLDMHLDDLDRIVDVVDAWIASNRGDEPRSRRERAAA